MGKAEKIRAFALGAVGSPYVYGGTGRPCTPLYRKARMEQYPRYAALIRQNCPVLMGTREHCPGCRHEGKACFDCAQLVRRALQQADILLPSGASSQWLKGDWLEKGPVDKDTRQRLCVVYREGGAPMKHTGLCLGDGWVVDARGHRTGVVKQRFEDYPWTHYALPRGLMEGREEKMVDVKQLQQLLLLKGFSLPRFGADGKWGGETKAAMQAYQQMAGLGVTEEADPATLDSLVRGDVTLANRVRRLEERMDAWEGKVSA